MRTRPTCGCLDFFLGAPSWRRRFGLGMVAGVRKSAGIHNGTEGGKSGLLLSCRNKMPGWTDGRHGNRDLMVCSATAEGRGLASPLSSVVGIGRSDR